MARLKCISRCQFLGDIVRPGDVVDVRDEVAEREPLAKTCFVRLGDSAAKPAAEGPVKIVAGLTREQVVLKLTGMRVAVPDGASDGELVKLYLAAVDQKPTRRGSR